VLVRAERIRDRSPGVAALRGIALPLLGALLLAGANPRGAPDGDPAAAAAARRARSLAIAERYVDFRWRATPRNALHGPDPDGVQVDTPDDGHRADGFHTDGRENVGIPYAWGGFSTPEEFERGLAEGKLAGHLPLVESAGGSRHTVGVDCSGFISRCWELPLKQTTRTLGALAIALDGTGALLPGDLLNSGDGHAVLFREYVDAERTRVRVYEAGFPEVTSSEYSLEELARAGMRPYRYGPLDPGWVPLPLRAPTWSEGQIGEFRATGPAEPVGEETLPSIDLGREVRGSYVRYRVTDGERDSGPGPGPGPGSAPAPAPAPAPGTGPGPGTGTGTGIGSGSGSGSDTGTRSRRDDALLQTFAIARLVDSGVELRSAIAATDPAAGAIETSRVVGRSRPFIDALEDFAIGEQRPTEVVTEEITRTPGTIEIAGKTHAAERIEAVRRGVYVVRKVRFDATLRIEALRSAAAPIHGIVELHEVLELVRGDARVGRSEQAMRLVEARRELPRY
jgi:hypothetical protein